MRNRNESAPLTVTALELSWTGGDDLDKQEIKKLIDLKTDTDYMKSGATYTFEPLDPGPPEVAASFAMNPVNWTIEADLTSGHPIGCTHNSDCQWNNLPGVRYVLNTLFNIKYQISGNEYARAAPIVSHPYLYQGSFEYPSYFGHFRRYDVTGVSPDADWDAGDSGKIPDAAGGNFSGRKVYTALDNGDGTRSVVDFDEGNVSALRAALGVTPQNNDDTDEIRVIKRIRGQDYDYDTDSYVERDNKLGGIMHSAPVVVRSGGSRFNNRPEMAYVGDLYGMLHAISTQDGTEKWAYIPGNLLGKLKNDRTDPNAVENFAAVDASPTAMDVYYDPDYDPEGQDPENKQWHTILVSPQGFGGKSIFALDVTDPESWSLLWESSDSEAPGGGMGYAYRVGLGKVKVPLLDEHGDPTGGYGLKWMVFVATSFAEIAENHGGINVFGYDLVSGDKLWTFSAQYADAVNDIPGAVTVFDVDGDTFADRIYVGDMNGRMWELAALDGTNPHGTVQSGDNIGRQIPLFSAGIGNPISVSPAVTGRNGQVILIFGTGGADWASNDKGYYVYSVDATAAGKLSAAEKSANYDSHGGAIDAMWALPLPVGQKVWSAPTIAAEQVWVAVSSGGTLESGDPKNDTGGGGELIRLGLDEGDRAWDEPLVIGDQVRGSLYVSRQHLYMTTIRGDIIQVGGGDFEPGTANRVVLRAWRQAR